MTLHTSPGLECLVFRENSPRDHYGRLKFGPVPHGQGITIGNTFRRILLSNLNGVSITAAKIKNVRSEFSTLPGVRESVLEIFLNLKEIVFFNEFPHLLAPQGKICVSGETQIKARDMQLPEGITLVDPNQHIATLVDSYSEFELTFVLEQGTGYRFWKKDQLLLAKEKNKLIPTLLDSSEPDTSATQEDTFPVEGELENNELIVNEETELEIPVDDGLFFPIDGIFMPINQVNFSVEELPDAGEYLFFEIWTNGSRPPREAFREAALILKELMESCLQESVKETEQPMLWDDVTLASNQSEPTSVESTPIEDLELSLRAYNCLKRAEILTLGDLKNQSYESLLSLRNFGEKSAKEVKGALERYGLHLRYDVTAEEG